MRPTPNRLIDPLRVVHPTLGGSPAGQNCGYFELPTASGLLRIIASDGDHETPWEHVSVSLADRTPTWAEMCAVKALFWSDEECVIQYHPPKSAYVNHHPFCLHLWKPTRAMLPMPPTILVGPRDRDKQPFANVERCVKRRAKRRARTAKD